MIHAAIHTHSKDDFALSAEVGDRIFPVTAPPDAPMPYVCFELYDVRSLAALDGPTGLAQGKVEFTAYGATHDSVRKILEAIRLRWDGFRGVVQDPEGPTTIGAVISTGEGEEVQAEPGNEKQRRYAASKVFSIDWYETIPAHAVSATH